MIFGHVGALECAGGLAGEIVRAIAYIREFDVKEIREGRYVLDGDVIIQLCERRTGKKEEKLPEVHRKYVELQYVGAGREYIGYYPDEGDNVIREDLLEEKDTLYYEENPKAHEVMLPLYPGSYAIFFPEDVHRPFCQIDGAEDVKKIVVKIPCSRLQ